MLPVMCLGSKTMPLYGPSGVVKPNCKNVQVEGRFVAAVGDIVTPHGNPYNKKKPGFNPGCKTATVMDGCQTVRVNGMAVAYIGAELTCMMHGLDLVPSKTVRVPGPAGGGE